MTAAISLAWLSIVGLRHTLPLTIYLQKQQIVGEVNPSTPSLFEDADNGQGIFCYHNIHTDLELLTGVTPTMICLSGSMEDSQLNLCHSGFKALANR